MSDVMRFVKGFKKQIADNTHVAKVCKIVRIDNIRGRADIQPIQKGLPMILNALVVDGKNYEPGDTVIAIFHDYALDGSSDDRHRIDDAIVLGKVRL